MFKEINEFFKQLNPKHIIEKIRFHYANAISETASFVSLGIFTTLSK